MRKWGFVLLFIVFAAIVKGQQKLPYEPFFQLDSIGKSNSSAKYFGRLYYDFLVRIEKQLVASDTSAQRLVRKFENVFADFFIDACVDCSHGSAINFPEWKPYFADTSLQEIQYFLLGANAHLNGGLWKAIVTSFTDDEMGQLKREFHYFKKSLNNTYSYVYSVALKDKRINSFDKLTFGISKWIGNYYLYKWRKRQMQLAKLYWQKSPEFNLLLAKVEKKKLKIDKKILQL